MKFGRAQGTLCLQGRALGIKQGPSDRDFATPVQEDKAEAEDGPSDVEDNDGNEWQEHDLAAFAGLRVSESNSFTKGQGFLFFFHALCCAEGSHINALKTRSLLWHS